MERPKYFLLIILIMSLYMCNSIVSAQDMSVSTRRNIVYHGYISGNIQEWFPVMEYLKNLPSPSTEEKLELLGYYYGYTGYLLGVDDKKNAKLYMESGNRLADEVLKHSPSNASALAYKGSFISFKIALNKIKAVTLGPESMKYINKAYKTDSLNIQALADKANMLYYAPGIFGGNKKEALIYFERAIKKLEDNNQTYRNWFYLNLMTLLAQYYEDAGNEEKSGKLYSKILSVEPDFNWAKENRK